MTLKPVMYLGVIRYPLPNDTCANCDFRYDDTRCRSFRANAKDVLNAPSLLVCSAINWKSGEAAHMAYITERLKS